MVAKTGVDSTLPELKVAGGKFLEPFPEGMAIGLRERRGPMSGAPHFRIGALRGITACPQVKLLHTT